jgi:hypothetical protein
MAGRLYRAFDCEAFCFESFDWRFNAITCRLRLGNVIVLVVGVGYPLVFDCR